MVTPVTKHSLVRQTGALLFYTQTHELCSLHSRELTIQWALLRGRSLKASDTASFLTLKYFSV